MTPGVCILGNKLETWPGTTYTRNLQSLEIILGFARIIKRNSNEKDWNELNHKCKLTKECDHSKLKTAVRVVILITGRRSRNDGQALQLRDNPFIRLFSAVIIIIFYSLNKDCFVNSRWPKMQLKVVLFSNSRNETVSTSL